MRPRLISSKGWALFIARAGKAFLLLTLGACSTDLATNILTDNPLKRPSMGMLPGELVRLWSKTPCQVETLYHNHPAEAWGYFNGDSGEAWPPEASSCDHANYWVYFEDGRLVGWTPPP